MSIEDRLLLVPFERHYWARKRLEAGLPLWGRAVFNPDAERRFEGGTGDGAWSARSSHVSVSASMQALGLHEGATAADVKVAFKALALKHHPDRGGDTATFQALAAARDACLAALKAAS